jgi:hypothetical protein
LTLIFAEIDDAAEDFDDTLTGAMQTYYDSMLEAQIARSESHYTASKDRYDALESAMTIFGLW